MLPIDHIEEEMIDAQNHREPDDCEIMPPPSIKSTQHLRRSNRINRGVPPDRLGSPISSQASSYTQSNYASIREVTRRCCGLTGQMGYKNIWCGSTKANHLPPYYNSIIKVYLFTK